MQGWVGFIEPVLVLIRHLLLRFVLGVFLRNLGDRGDLWANDLSLDGSWLIILELLIFILEYLRNLALQLLFFGLHVLDGE